MIGRFTSIFLLSIAVLLFPDLLFADQVTPSDRVTSHVNIRYHPNSQSKFVGTLGVNETAEFLKSAPYWHKIRLSNGVGEFASKAWSLRELSKAVLKLLIDTVAAGDSGTDRWYDIRDELLGPISETAIGVLAKHQGGVVGQIVWYGYRIRCGYHLHSSNG